MEHFLPVKSLKPQGDLLDDTSDLFEGWLGDDLIPEELNLFLDALRRLSDNGTRLYIMRGNRDFLLGERFEGHAASGNVH